MRKFIIFSHYIHIKDKSVIYDELKLKEQAILNANSIYSKISLFSPLYNIILSQTAKLRVKPELSVLLCSRYGIPGQRKNCAPGLSLCLAGGL